MRTLTGQSIPNIDPASTDYPYGRAKNSNPPAARNGTPLNEKNLMTDCNYAMLAVMKAASITPNENAENINNSQFLDAINTLISNAVNPVAAETNSNSLEIAALILLTNILQVQGNIFVKDNTNVTVISGIGVANKVKFEHFTSISPYFGVTLDTGNNKIVINSDGVYEIICTIGADSSGAGGGGDFSFQVFKNDGLIGLDNVHCHRTMSGGGGEKGSITLSGQVQLSEDDELELFMWNENSTQDLILEDVSLSIKKIRSISI